MLCNNPFVEVLPGQGIGFQGLLILKKYEE
jgi:hypothetical protein